MQKLLRNLPIRQKLIVLMVLSGAVSLMLGSVGIFIYEAIAFRRDAVEDASALADLIASSSTAALSFGDKAAANDTLNSVKLERRIVSASIYDRSGQLFASYTRNGSTLPVLDHASEKKHRFENGYLHLSREISLGNERLGTVTIVCDLSDMYDRMTLYGGIIVIVMGVAMLSTYLLSAQLQRLVSTPVLSLAGTARTIRDQRDYSIRAEKFGNDEIGTLIEVFNQMVAQIQSNDASLQQANQQLNEANRTKDEFLAMLSHELRTPLTPILAWTRMLRSGKLDADSAQHGLDIIDKNVKIQSQLIEDLLDVSRIIAGKMRLNVMPTDVEQTLKMAVESVRNALEAKSINIETIIPADLPPVSADPDRLQQIFWNLLTNAVKFTPANGCVQVRAKAAGKLAEITIKDSGEGLSPEFLPHVFERFKQADSTVTRSHGGLGLGLSIVKHLVELHGGTIRAESAGKDLGATFIVTLPFSKHSLDKAHAAAVVTGPVLAGLKLLMVDDESDSLEPLVLALQHCGAHVTAVTSASDALEQLQKSPPDVLISDIAMPGEDGFSLLRKVRKLDAAHGGNVPAVALTAFARQEDRDKTLAAGFQSHVAKPIDPAALAEAIEKVAAHGANE